MTDDLCTNMGWGLLDRNPITLFLQVLLIYQAVRQFWNTKRDLYFLGVGVERRFELFKIAEILQKLIPCSRILPKILTASVLTAKFPEIYGNRKFITAFIRVRHLSLSWAKTIQFIPPSPFLKIYFNIIFLFTPGHLAEASFRRVSPRKSCMHISSPSYVLHARPISFFETDTYWWKFKYFSHLKSDVSNECLKYTYFYWNTCIFAEK
jgi:hypothetical protein